MRALAPLLLAAVTGLVACAPLPEGGPRALTAEGVRPGAGAAAVKRITPPLGVPIRYQVRTPLRESPNGMEVVLAREGDGYLRTETVRIPESSVPEARLIATMVRQRDGRAAEVDGTDVVLRTQDRIDARGRTLASDLGGVQLRWDPHDCHAVMGECRTARTNADERVDYLVVTTSESGGLWHEAVRRDPARDPQGRSGLLQESIYSMDEDGVLLDMNRLDRERDLGGYQEIRRVE